MLSFNGSLTCGTSGLFTTGVVVSGTLASGTSLITIGFCGSFSSGMLTFGSLI
jgi:hypothetical protein